MAADTDVALAYVEAGWPVFPLPLGRKHPPPEGRTGAAGVDMPRAEVELYAWAPSNIGVRMPLGVVGLDVDAYHGGRDTRRELEARLGRLPPTYWSHSGRNDGSGIAMFRVPPTARFVGSLPGIEVIQRHHRYACVWPSVHPDGRQYAWHDGIVALGPLDGVPRVADLPELPEAWCTYLAMAQHHAAEGDLAPVSIEAATADEVEAFLAVHVEALAAHYLGVITDLFTTKVAEGFSRHDTMTHALIWAMECVRAGMVNGRVAVDALGELWLQAFNRPASRQPAPSEWLDMLRHAVAKAQVAPAERIDGLFIEHVGFRVEGGGRLVDAAGGAAVGAQAPPAGIALPERFWHREHHHVVRACAELVGLAPEALVLGVLAAVALHVPPTVRLPGKRWGQVNLMACVVGPPGAGKGTTLDRALQLVPPPPTVEPIALGTPQGLVRAFYERNTEPEGAKAQPFVRHARAVIVRTDEVAAFAQATKRTGSHGEGMLAHLKSAVSGERVGGGYAADDRNLALAAHSYRLVGVLGIAPAKAAPLFDDLGGGLPERLLFAPVLPHHVEAVELPELAEDDHDMTPGLVPGHEALPPLAWRLPVISGRQAFTDSRNVAAWLSGAGRQRGADLDAHVVYLRHQVAALLAVLDGRWTVTGADLVLAGDVLDVSRAARAELLGQVEAEGRKAGQARKAEAVDQANALADLAERRDVLAMAHALTEDARDTPGVTVKALRDRVRSARRRLFDLALTHAVEHGLVEERREGEGGQVKRTLWPRL